MITTLKLITDHEIARPISIATAKNYPKKHARTPSETGHFAATPPHSFVCNALSVSAPGREIFVATRELNARSFVTASYGNAIFTETRKPMLRLALRETWRRVGENSGLRAKNIHDNNCKSLYASSNYTYPFCLFCTK